MRLSKKHRVSLITVGLVLCVALMLVIGLLHSLHPADKTPPPSYAYPGARQTFTANTCMSHLTLEAGSFKPGARSGMIKEVNLLDGTSTGRSFGDTYTIAIDGFSVPFADTYSDQLKVLHPDCPGVLPNVNITCQLTGEVTASFIQYCLSQTGTLPVKPESCRMTYIHNLFSENSVDSAFTFEPDNRILIYAPQGFRANVAFERVGYFYVSQDSMFLQPVTITGREIQLFQWAGSYPQDILDQAQKIQACVSSYWTFVYYPATQW